jgi:hypothetical protein
MRPINLHGVVAWVCGRGCRKDGSAFKWERRPIQLSRSLQVQNLDRLLKTMTTRGSPKPANVPCSTLNPVLEIRLLIGRIH